WGQYRNGGPNFFSVADSMIWSGRERVTATVTNPGSTLGEGNVNTFRFWGKPIGTTPDPIFNYKDFVALDWIDVDYWRRYRGIKSYLSANSADGAGEIQLQATNFVGNDVRVYDVTDSVGPVRLTLDPTHIVATGGGEFSIEFQDSVAAGAKHSYVVFANPTLLSQGGV